MSWIDDLKRNIQGNGSNPLVNDQQATFNDKIGQLFGGFANSFSGGAGQDNRGNKLSFKPDDMNFSPQAQQQMLHPEQLFNQRGPDAKPDIYPNQIPYTPPSAESQRYDMNSPVGNGDGDTTEDTGYRPQQEDPFMKMLSDAMSANPYESGPYMENLNSARSAQLNAIAGAEKTTNDNFNTSNANIGAMFERGKQDTLAQGATLQAQNDNLQGGLKGMYGGAVEGLQADRSKEIAEKGDMLQRLGIQQAGLGTSGDVQTKAIANVTAEGASQGAKAAEYGGADQTANVARANSMTAQGAARQGELRSQLAGVLGQLTNKRVDVENNYANQSMQARNQSYQDNLSKISALVGMRDKQQAFEQNERKINENSSTRAAAIRALGKGGSTGGSTGIDDANSFVAAHGGNPGDFNNAYTKSNMEATPMMGTSSTEQEIAKAMKKNNPGLDDNLIMQYARIAARKATASSSSGGDSSAIMGLLNGQ